MNRPDPIDQFHFASDDVLFHGVPVPVLRAVLAKYHPNRKLTFRFLAGVAQLIRFGRLGHLPEYNKAWTRHHYAVRLAWPW